MYTVTSEDTGREFRYESEAAYEAALDWYNGADSKDAIIRYCAGHGIDLVERPGKLVPDWADVAMELWASKR